MAELTLIATAAFGLEAVVKRELLALGMAVENTENGRVTVRGGIEDLVRCNLWLRSSERVLLVIGEFEAVSFEELFDKTYEVHWEECIPKEGVFPVEGKSIKSTLYSISDCQAIVKKAISRKLGEKYSLDWLSETGSTFPVQVALLKDRVTLTIDTSGAGLHRRGYRDYNAPAPLRETLAAALLSLSYWNRERLLWDPFCGSGTIPVEAAMMGMNMAPGLNRSFVSEGWPQIPSFTWEKCRNEARDAVNWDVPLDILGSDNDPEALRLAKRHVHRAGVEDKVRLEQKDFQKAVPSREYGCLVTNPPYGERMGEIEEVENIYRKLGALFRRLDTWSKYVLTAHRGFERLSGLEADRKRKLYNGRIQCNYYQYYGPKPPVDNNYQTYRGGKDKCI